MRKSKTVLGDICKITMGQSPDSSTYHTTNIGLPFYQGNADFGELYPKTRIWCSRPQKIAEPENILLSVRAPIGALNIAKEKCCIGRGLAAIAPHKNFCFNKYLFYILKYKHNELNARGTGSTFKAINKSILNDLPIDIYPIDRQKRIAAILDKATELIALRKQQIQKLDLLVKSRFIEMFGNPVSNDRNWDTKNLSELGELNRGISKHRPRNAPELLGGNYPLIQTSEIAAAELYVTKYTSTYSELGYQQSKIWPKGTLCITIAANIAKTAILKFDACFPDSVVGFISDSKTNQLFIHFWFSFFQKILEEQAPESAQKNINLQILRALQVINPPLSLQNEFAAFVEQVEKTKSILQQSLEKLELNYKALMQTYFG